MSLKPEFNYTEIKAKNGRPEKLIVLLHGYGLNSDSLLKTANLMHDEIPNADILVVDGLYPRFRHYPRNNPRARTWFSTHLNWTKLRLRLIFNRMADVDYFNKQVDLELQKRGLKDKDMAMFGFSMGGGFALYASQSRDAECAAVVCHSGTYPGWFTPKSKPKTLFIAGADDEVFPSYKLATRGIRGAWAKKISLDFFRASSRLRRRGIPVTRQIVPHLKHRINQQSSDASIAFIKKALK